MLLCHYLLVDNTKQTKKSFFSKKKDKTEVLCYPCDHDEYLRQKYGYERELYRDEVTPEYERDVQTYVVPSTVTVINELAFSYTNLQEIYLSCLAI